MIGQVRVAYPSLVIQGKDYYQDLKPYFLTLAYTDNCDGEKADDLHIQLADRDNKFISDWMPDPGTYIDASIICERWFSPLGATISLDCGRFWIDEVEFELPQHTCSIKAQSIPTGVRIKVNDETRGWENSNLKDITAQIAGENKMQPDYKADFNPQYKRVEQVDESGLQFLKKRSDAAKLAIKVHRGKIVVYDEQTLESAAPKFALVYGDARAPGGINGYHMKGAHFQLKVMDTTKITTVNYVNPETGRLTHEKFDASTVDENADPNDDTHEHINEAVEYAPDGKTAQALLMTPRNGNGGLVSDWTQNSPGDNSGKGAGGNAAGQRLAKSRTRKRNKYANECKIELGIGNPLIAAGQVFQLIGCGQFDANWIIKSAEHKVGPMYTTTLDCHRCLTSY